MEKQYLEQDYLYKDENALQELKEIRSEIDYARKHGEIERALFLYTDYVECDVFRLYCKNAIEILPEFMELLDENYAKCYKHKINLMIGYKWVLCSVDEFLWFSHDDLVEFYRNYHDLCLKYGYSLRTYYQGLWTILMDHKNLQPIFDLSIEEVHRRYRAENKDILTDDDSIEDGVEVVYSLFIEKNPQKALEIIKPYFNGEKRGREIPHQSYYVFARYYFENGGMTSHLILILPLENACLEYFSFSIYLTPNTLFLFYYIGGLFPIFS